MATIEHPSTTSADDRAWELFFEALDGDTGASADTPPGAAIIAADEPDLDELVRRYHADRRSVVVVHADGRREVRRARQLDRLVIGGLLVAAIAWVAARGRDLVAH
jgi:hypothetical protein